MASENPTSPAAEAAAAASSPSAPAESSSITTTSPNATIVPPEPPKSPQPTGDVAILKEAFPDIDVLVIRAVLKASKGDMDAAFNALLSMSDPNYEEEPAPPPRQEVVPELPPRRSSRQPPPQGDYDPAPIYHDTSIRGESRNLYEPARSPRSQLEADELYARQLQEHFASEGRQQQRRPGPRGGPPGDYDRRDHARRRDSDDSDNREHSFLDDDLPVIKENIRQGFLQTQEKVNRWVSEFKKKIDGEFAPENEQQHQHGGPARASTFGGTQGDYNQGRTQQPRPRYSQDHYDADPHVLPDDFAHLEIRDNTNDGPPLPAKPARPAANPGLMALTPLAAPKGTRKVSFQDAGDDDLYAPTPPAKPNVARQPSPSSTPGGSKWEPLRSVEPQPMDKDPFSLGDSDDEDNLPAGGKTGKQETGVVEKKDEGATTEKK